MKVWHGITLALWTAVMALCLTVILYNQALHSTILSADWTKKSLAGSTVYDALRDTAVGYTVQGIVGTQYPQNQLIDKSVINPVLAEVMPRSEVAKRLEPSIDSIYQWLDSKQPAATISLSFEDKRDQFYRSLELAIAKRISAMPDCGDYRYPPEEAILNDGCLPAYVTAGEATQAVMGGIRSINIPLSFSLDDIAPSIAGAATPLKRIPTYLNYLWVLNLIAIAILIYLVLLVVISRRAIGVIAIGVSCVITGIILLSSQVALSNITLPNLGDFTAPIMSAIDTLTPKLARVIASYAVVSVIVGVAIVTLGGFWIWTRHRSSLITNPKKAITK